MLLTIKNVKNNKNKGDKILIIEQAKGNFLFIT